MIEHGSYRLLEAPEGVLQPPLNGGVRSNLQSNPQPEVADGSIANLLRQVSLPVPDLGPELQALLDNNKHDRSERATQRKQRSDRQQGHKLAETAEFDSATNHRLYQAIVGINTRILIANAVRFTLYAAALITFVPFLATHAPLAGLAAAVYYGYLYLKQQHLITNLTRTHPSDHQMNSQSKDFERIDSVAQQLANKMGIDKPKLLISARHESAYIFDSVFGQDSLHLSREIIKKTSPEQLTAIIAHELSHANRAYTVISRLAAHTFTVVSLTLFASVAFGLSQFFLATSIYLSSKLAHSLIAAFISRQNEIKTDLRAINVTKDPETYLSMLKVIDKSKAPGVLELVLTHPLGSKRTKPIERVFGVKASSGSQETYHHS